MINITVSSKTSLFNMVKEITEDINHNMIEIETQVDEIALDALWYMKMFIAEHVKRHGSTGTLIESINLEHTGTKAGTGYSFWGIGNRDELDDKAPYWHLLNFGGMSLPAQVGMGVPGLFNGERADPSKRGTNGGNERFQHEWKTGMMFPKFPIEPMGYIENTEFYLMQQIDALLSSK